MPSWRTRYMKCRVNKRKIGLLRLSGLFMWFYFLRIYVSGMLCVTSQNSLVRICIVSSYIIEIGYGILLFLWKNIGNRQIRWRSTRVSNNWKMFANIIFFIPLQSLNKTVYCIHFNLSIKILCEISYIYHYSFSFIIYMNRAINLCQHVWFFLVTLPYLLPFPLQ